MTKLLLLTAAVAASAVLAGSASAAPRNDWSSQANQVCTVYVAKAKQLFAKPVQASGLYKFAKDVKTLETSEFNALDSIPGRAAAGNHALVALRGDIGMVVSAIHAYDKGDKATFVKDLKAYLNSTKPKVAFAAAGASKCG
jgi:outer membrane murein-binding lipoprotein Lpp